MSAAFNRPVYYTPISLTDHLGVSTKSFCFANLGVLPVIKTQ